MASTHTTADALEIVRKRPEFRAVDDSGFYLTAANSALTLMWNAYPWDQSVKDFPPFFLIPNQAYHTAPYIEIPSDFNELHEVWLQVLYGQRHDLQVRKRLRPSLFAGDPQRISYIPERSGFLIVPTPAEGWASPESQVVGTYKTLPPLVTNNNISSGALPFSDRHYHVFIDALAWAYAKYGGVGRPGESVWQDGRVVRTGLLGSFYDSLQESINSESQGRGVDEMVPGGSLMENYNYA